MGDVRYISIHQHAHHPQRTHSHTCLADRAAAGGAYQAVMRSIKACEAEDSLLAVKLVQITGIDGATDTVRASIGLVAYLEAEDG